MSEPQSTWSRLESLFAQALQLPASERRKFVARECAGNPYMQDELSRLLAAEAEAADFLAPPTLNFRGHTFGSYEALEEIGRGGMSVVYKGRRRDGDFEKLVAIKILLLHPDQNLQASETQILAGLEHPNIARLLDAGSTPSGFRFLVMEYVDGVACPQYAAKLPLDQKLRLFLSICRAVQFSHQSLVVHRDLKPANILVTSDGTAKLLDFGIAKLLRSDPALNQTHGIRAYTPDYASPEQILGGAVTTASDVYSLGALLCELVSGRPPRQLNTLSTAELVAEVQRDSLPQLSFAGDLAAIAQKALRRLPSERYPSASELANDVERFLNQEPVAAQVPTWSYRTKKFLRRHRLAASAAALAIVALATITGLALWQARVALDEKARAEEVKEFITSIFQSASNYQAGSLNTSALTLLTKADARIDQMLGSRPELRAELRAIVAESLSTLHEYPAAIAVSTKAVNEAKQQLGPAHQRTLHATSILLALQRFSQSNEELEKGYKQLVELMRTNRQVDPAYFVHALQNYSGVTAALGKLVEAEALTREALVVASKTFKESDQQMMSLLVHAAFQFQRIGKFPEALQAAERVHRITFQTLRQDLKHPNSLDVRMSYGMALADMKQWEKALPMLKDAVRDAGQSQGLQTRTAAFFNTHLGRYLLQAGELAEGIEAYKRASEIFANDKTAFQAYVGAIHNHASATLAARRTNEAIELFELGAKRRTELKVPQLLVGQASLALAKALSGDLATAREALLNLEAEAGAKKDPTLRPILYMHGVVLRLSGDYEKALANQQKALLTGTVPPKERAQCDVEIGLNQLELGKLDAAAASLEKARSWYEQNVPRMIPPHADALSGLARVALRRNQAAAALPLAQRADEFWTSFDPMSRWAALAALTHAECLKAGGQLEASNVLYARAAGILAKSKFPGDALAASR